MLRKFIAAIAALIFAGVAPAEATSITLTGAGGVFIGSGPLSPPAITPQVSAAFDINSVLGSGNNALTMPASGPTELPATPSNSWYMTVEGTIDANLSTSQTGTEYALANSNAYALLSVFPATAGSPEFTSQLRYDGTAFAWWYGTPGINLPPAVFPTAAATSNTNPGLYQWTGQGGNCAREPSGYFGPTVGEFGIADPGFGCVFTPAVVIASIPGFGMQQTLSTGATSCVSNSPVSGEMTVTTTVGVAHGVYPGGSFTLSGFTGAGNTGYNATYNALIGTTGTTLVGEATGSCPANSPDTSGGLALSGTGGAVTMPSTTNTLAAQAGQGITTHANQKFSCVIGEFGADSATPGVAFSRCVDGKTGSDLYGSPAVVNTALNEGASNFTGYVLGLGSSGSAPEQDTSFPVTASISAAGVMNVTANTFTSSATVNGTTTLTTSGTPTGVIAVGMTVTGTDIPGGTTITALGTGTGAAGTYTMSQSATGSSSITATFAGVLSVGQTVTGPSLPRTTIASLGTGTGGTGTYNLAAAQAGPLASGTYTVHTYAPALDVTALNSYSISAASWASTGNGQATFTTTAAHGLVPGSVFTVSGVSPSGYNQTYIALAGTTGSTLVGGEITSTSSITPVALANPGAYSSGGSASPNIEPGMMITGTTGSALISPYGTYGSSGTGGTGSYALSANQGTWTITAGTGGVASTSLVVATQGGTGSYEFLAAGVGLTGSGVSAGTYIQTTVNGGGAGAYTLNQNATVSTGTTLTTTGNIWSSSSPGNLYAAPPFYYHPLPNTAAYGGSLSTHTQTNFGNIVGPVGSEYATSASGDHQWGGSLANVGMHWTVFPQNPPGSSDGAGNPSLTALQSIAEKTTDFLALDSANGGSTQSMYRLSDTGIWGDSSNATITGYISGASGATATLNVSSTVLGSLALATGTETAYLTGPGLNGGQGAYATLPLTTTGSSTYTLTFSSGTAANLGSSGSPVQFNVGKQKPLGVQGNGLITGYLTASGGSGPCASGPCLHVTGFQTSSQYWAGTASLSGTAGTYQDTLTINSTTTGTPAIGDLCFDSTPTDLTGPPLAIAAGTTSPYTVGNNYYLAGFTSDANMYCTLAQVTPNQYLLNAGLATPVMVTGYANGSQGGLGDYTISTAANGAVGSSGSPVNITLSGVFGGGAPSPGPALTIADHGPGTTYAITNRPTASPTGSIPLSGTYSTASLGGTPSAIQAQLSLTANGPAVSGFSWANLSSQTIGSGNWSGTITGVPPGEYWVSVRAANGTAYATLPNVIMVGDVWTLTGEGNYGSCTGTLGGSVAATNWGFFDGSVVLGFTDPIFGPAVINDLKPSSSQAALVNRYSPGGTVAVLPECTMNQAQTWWNLAGTPLAQLYLIRNGTGIGPDLWGNQSQVQTLGIGDGTSTTWCSSASLCANDSSSLLTFNAASLSGAQITGYVTTSGGVSTLTVSTIIGALEPGLILSGSGVSGSPTLVACKVVSSSSCNFNSNESGTAIGSNWLISANLGTIGSSGSPVAFTLTPSGGAALPNGNLNATGTGPVGSFSTSVAASVLYGWNTIAPGTFSVSVNGTVVCSDTTAFSYTVASGQCAGAGIASSFINYGTGAYEINFSSPPASGAAINATWTTIMSADNTGGPELVDWFGTSTSPTSGLWASAFDKAPGGPSANVFGGCGSDWGPAQTSSFGYPRWAIGYTQQLAELYGTKVPAIFPGAVSAPLLMAVYWRNDGPNWADNGTYATAWGVGSMACDQWARDATTSSHFTGYVTAGGTPTLTLTAAASGPMWEGEVIGCNPYSAACALPVGTWITGLSSGTWGASGSVYSLTAPLGSSTITSYGSSGSPVAMLNEVYYGDAPESHGAPGYFVGPFNDNSVQETGGVGGLALHPAAGIAGGRRIGTRIAALAAGPLSANPSLTAAPTLSRSVSGPGACDSSATTSPCFDVSAAYQASASATWSGSTVTISGGLSAHARPFVDGMAISCSGCNSGLYIVSVSAPPTQSTVSGAGQVGNTFTFTANGAIGGSGSGTIDGGCSGTAGTGSNCIDMAFSINVSGTFGTAAALATCGANNLQGTPSGVGAVPLGKCVDGGIGSIVRNFRIGSSAWMGVGDNYYTTAGNYYDDGADFIAANYNQSGAFTCNIVAAKVVQCVKGPVYTKGVPSGVGEWLSGATFVEYGDDIQGVGRSGGITGNVGGQSFAFTAGSGYTNNSSTAYVGTAVSGSCAIALGPEPKIDVWVSGGAIVDVYPSSATGAMTYGIGGACSFPAVSNTNYAGIGSGSGGAITALTQGPNEGQGGVVTTGSNNNTTGVQLYDNSCEPGNPLATLNVGCVAPATNTYFEPGLPVVPWGQFYGAAVSG